MTIGRYYGSVMPIAGVLYAIALVISHGNGMVATVGALIFALIAVTGRLVVGLVRSRTP